MNASIQTLCDSLRNAIAGTPAWDFEYNGDWLPWESWLLVCLARHRERQRWLANIVRDRLDGDLQLMADIGALGHPDRPQLGPVPGDPQWKYYFHGGGCCLTHRVTGESIDVDFFDDSGDWFSRFFFDCYLRSLKQPAFPEQRLLALHPRLRALELAFDSLMVRGALFQHPERHVVRLHDDCEILAGVLAEADIQWNDQNTCLSFAAAFNDWSYVEDAPVAQQNADRRKILVSAGLVFDDRAKFLKQKFNSDETANTTEAAFCGMAALNHSCLPDMITGILRATTSGVVTAALEVISELAQPDFTEQVVNLIQRFHPGGTPAPYQWIMAAEYLLRRGKHTELIRTRLRGLCFQDSAKAALLALEFFPKEARRLFRAALRDVPYNRTTAAAALAILDEPWCHEELLTVLESSSDQEETHDARLALIACDGAGLSKAVQRWEAAHPYQPPEGSDYTIRDMMIGHQPAYFSHELSELHDQVLPFRGRVTG